MRRFTTEFGMGSGGSNALWSSSKLVAASGFSRCSELGMWYQLVLRVLANLRHYCRLQPSNSQIVWVLYGQASRAISTG